MATSQTAKAVVVPKRSIRKEAIVAVAAIGIALIVWNWRDKIAGFWSYLGFSSCSSVCSAEKDKEPVRTSSEKPESTAEPVAQPAEQVGNVAPEAVAENGKTPVQSVYMGLPNADPSTVSKSLPPSVWPGATKP
ncbi:unnamed protein product [Caenorhabditis sp. 36 PRJEB53466]|nr:unnamed protein product [Caenorhabditis sp. 36 PRJEB53466]